MEARRFVKDGSWKARLTCFRDAARGLGVHFASQANARIQAGATVLAIGLGFVLGLTAMEWTAIVLAIGLVWVAETLNTALEFLVDFVSPEIREEAGRVKDISAGAVLLAAITAAAVGTIIFGRKLLTLAAS
ncbi:MAG TPA: diacylglycerol kinase family protein [Chthoniobacteraceae bacterium]|jgi:diacylglycerol kinase (ATP)